MPKNDHEEHIEDLKAGFHNLIRNVHRENIDESLGLLEERIDQKLVEMTSGMLPASRMDSLKKQLTSLALDVNSFREQLVKLDKKYRKDVVLLSKKIDDLVPSERLAKLESKIASSPKERPYESVLKGFEERRKTGEKELASRQTSFEREATKSISSLSSRMTNLTENLNTRMNEKETELVDMVSRGDSAMSKKMNARFLVWLGGLEDEVKKMTESKLESIEQLRKELESLRAATIKKKDMEEFEEQVLGPLEVLENKIQNLVKKEASKLESRLKKTQSLEKIDYKTLQKEINKMVKSMEKQRTETLEEELVKMIKEGERLKRKKM